MEHEVEGEGPGVGVSLGKGVAALMLTTVVVGEPTPNPRGGAGQRLGEEGVGVEPHTNEVWGTLLDARDRRQMVARAERAHDRSPETTGHLPTPIVVAFSSRPARIGRTSDMPRSLGNANKPRAGCTGF